MIPVALTIAGSDPSGGAGIQADLKTFHQFHVYGMAAIALLTIQNTRTVKKVVITNPKIVRDQINTILQDIKPAAIKTGALGNKQVIQTIAQCLKSKRIPLVVDP